MSLSSGSRLGSYEITHVLGTGGMGEVYRARDSRLGRSVAIKVILDGLGADPDRIARFEREAKVLAAINHPNIAALYGLEEWNGQQFLVMELVEGETLAERLQRGPIEIEEALRIALQIAEALEAAHDRSVVHRDLKPANIKITPEDKVKVLDFGLAKTNEADPSQNVANSPTLIMMATSAGVILGTAAYMSPEQAKGFAADHRSDVFSFGVVLFEMLTGGPPFQGETAPDILASVLVREPEMHRLPADLNPRIVEMLRRCLAKNPKRRWQAVGDLRAEIEAVLPSPRIAASQVFAVAPPRPLWRLVVPVAVTSAMFATLAAVAAWQLKPAPPREITRLTFGLPEELALTGVGGKVFDISPDGRSVVYTAGGGLYVRSMSSGIATQIRAGEGQVNVFSPVFSPDGQSVAFHTEEGVLKRAHLAGGAATTVCAVPNRSYWLTWAGDNLFFNSSDGLMRVPAAGGTPEKIIGTRPEERIQRAQVLTDRNIVLYTVVPAGMEPEDRWASGQIVAHSLETGARKVLVTGASDGWYTPTGHLLYMIGGTLHAVRFDAASLELKGTVLPIVEGVIRSTTSLGGIGWFSVSSTGTLIYLPGPASVTSTQLDLGIVERNGTVTTLKLPPAPYRHPRVSPDGQRIVLETDDGKDAAVRVYELSRGDAPQRLTFAGKNRFPIWTSDSRRVAFQSDRQGDPGIFWQVADGSRAAERLTTAAPGESHIPESWHPDGDVLLFSIARGPDYSLWTYSVRDKRKAPFGDVRASIPTDGVFSPDGKWVAYSSGAFAQATIFIQPFPATGAKYRITREDRQQCSASSTVDSRQDARLQPASRNP